MKPFAYVNAANEKEAVAALSSERGKFLPMAGGMDLLALMKDYIAQPERLVNVKNLDKTIAKAPMADCASARPSPSRISRRMLMSRGCIRRWRRRLPKSAHRRSGTLAPSAATSTSARAAGTTATRSSIA